MKLLTQADDFGFTRACTYGIVDSIDLGILRNTGLFANSEHAEWACSFMKDRPHVCFGIDFNIVSGPSVLTKEDIPHLVDDNNIFHRSSYYMKQDLYKTKEGQLELFPIEEVRKELWAQYERFIELAGKKPGYVNAHSLCPETYMKVIYEIAEKENLPYSQDFLDNNNFKGLPEEMSMDSSKEFRFEKQLNKDLVSRYMENSEWLLQQEKICFWNHPGYVDAELVDGSSLSIERMRDAQSCMDPRMIQWVKDNNIELVTYYDFK